MPNRLLSGELARSESLSRVSLEAEVAFLHLISVADDFGRFDGRPAVLLASLFPTRLDTVSMEALTRWLGELEAEGLLHWYEVSGRRYLELPSWPKHQRIRAARSKYPNPLPIVTGPPQFDGGSPTDDSRGWVLDDKSPQVAADCRGSPSNDSESQRKTAVVEVGVGVEDDKKNHERASPAAARSNGVRRGTTSAPEELTNEQLHRLLGMLWKNRPWLLTPGMEDTAPHCHRRWIESQIQETLSYWRGRGQQKADWVLTCANRIYSEDGRRWEKLGEPPPIAKIFHERYGAEAPK